MEHLTKHALLMSKRLRAMSPLNHSCYATNNGDASSQDRMPEPIKPHFFKIILAKDIQECKLYLPTKFALMFGNNHCSPATLEIPTGAKWTVRLLKQDCRIWFDNGWKEFADYYGLRQGYCVLFRHKPDSNFEVFIFDRSTMEIDYPYGVTNPTSGLMLLEPKVEAADEVPGPAREDEVRGASKGNMEEEAIDICISLNSASEQESTLGNQRASKI